MTNEIPEGYIKVLDKGYVGLTDHMGSDLTPVATAKVSYDKTPKGPDLNPREEKLLRFLADEGHGSPFRHAVLQFEIYAPLMVARQHWKYQVASAHLDDQNGWNESSRRYITEVPTFYVPTHEEWRGAPANSKQGSGDCLPSERGAAWTEQLELFYDMAESLYDAAIADGIAPEQARLFLPAYGLYVRYKTTVSLAALLHLLKERLPHDAQKEIQLYAKAMHDLAQPLFPRSFDAYGFAGE